MRTLALLLSAYTACENVDGFVVLSLSLSLSCLPPIDECVSPLLVSLKYIYFLLVAAFHFVSSTKRKEINK